MILLILISTEFNGNGVSALEEVFGIRGDATYNALLIVGIVIAAILFIWLFFMVHRMLMELAFRQEYGVAVPADLRIKKAKKIYNVASFELQYPEWKCAKKDGTRDSRKKDMGIIYNKSLLHIGKWELTSRNPFIMYYLICALRCADVRIRCCNEERVKKQKLLHHVQMNSQIDSVIHIIERFSENPAGFESFCAELFCRLGYQVQTTPATRDGGFDLKLEKDSLTYLVECKCYSLNHHVGRPAIQKLQGANSLQHADVMMMVTTSDFTSDAIEFSQQTGVQLVNGTQLIQLYRQAQSGFMSQQEFLESEIELTKRDILDNIPTDMWGYYE